MARQQACCAGFQLRGGELEGRKACSYWGMLWVIPCGQSGLDWIR